MMQLSAAGLALTKSFEGLRLKAYRDAGGVLTIGYGHTGSDVWAGQVITEPEASALLHSDMAHAIASVNRLVTVSLTQRQFDALCDFAFNVGCGAFQRSHLLSLINLCQFTAAAEQFGLWIKVNGRPCAGLQRRRQAEAALYRSSVT